MALMLAGFASTATISADEADTKYYGAIVEFDSDATLAEMEAQGVKILRHRENLALALIPQDYQGDQQQVSVADNNGDLSSNPYRRLARSTKGVIRVEPSRRAMPVLDEAHKHYDAYRVYTGEGLKQPYTGKGVVTGICDTFFDPGHPMFYDADGHSRIARYIVYQEENGNRIVMDSEEEYLAFGTDNESASHATHVAAIMAGSEVNGYRGSAPGSEMVITVSQLSDVGLLAGAEDIIEYAKEQQKPAVINMSVGGYTGPHDGTSLFSRYLDLLGKEAIICMAAGNEGDSGINMNTTFSESVKNTKVRIHCSNWTQFEVYGAVDIWSKDDLPIEARLNIFDSEQNKDICSMPVWISSGTRENPKEKVTMYLFDDDPEFSKYFKKGSIVAFHSELNPLNGRSHLYIEFNAATDINRTNPDEHWARYTLTLETKGEPGVYIDQICDVGGIWFATFPGYPNPTNHMCVSDLATGQNLVSVGMYSNRTGAVNLSEQTEDWTKTDDIKIGYVHPDSGFATLSDGRVTPLTVAPGAALISAYSSYFTEANPTIKPVCYSKAERNGREYYWGRDGGTSMATPYAAGYIATWLEACPTLTIDDVKKIIEETNSHDYQNPDDPRNGRGWLNPYNGLLKAIEMSVNSGIRSPEIVAESALRLVLQNGAIELWNATGAAATLHIYDASGRLVDSHILSDTHSIVTPTNLSSGTYIIRATAQGANPASLKAVL